MHSPHNPDHLVRTQHRRRRHTTLVWALAFAVIAVALAGMDHLGWFKSGLLAGLGCAAVASGLIIRWIIRARRIDTGAVARDLDSQWSLQARLEAAAELSGDQSAMAAAQRADTAAKLAGHRAPRALAWHAGQFVLIVALLLFLAESGIFGFRILFAKPAPVPPPPAADISASIEWRSPESELKATAIEEIPLVAAADSHTGFRAMSLEVSVNGEPRLSRPLDAATLAALAKPGPHPVKLPLYLDEAGAGEFDMVAYHLRADRTTNPPSPAVTSPLQFIQIRPAREDVGRMKAGAGKGKLGELSSMIGALKAAQLALLKQNFLLAHAQISKTDKVWTEANTTVAADQKTLAGKVAEARTFAIAEEMPTLVVDNLTQIIPLMEDASALIAKTSNEPAARPQGHVLGLLTELEKLIRKIIIEGGGGSPPPKNPDPFKDDQRYKLPPRAETPAGQLEQLAQDQTEQAKKTEPAPSSPSASAPKPPSAEDQAELARRADELAKNQHLSPDAQKAAAQAARDAAAAANQLKQGDVSAARAPAQAAAQTLRETAAAQEKAGREAARAQLEAARRALDEAAREPDAATRAAKLDAIAAELQAAARAQQESGSAEAARQLQAADREAAKAAEAARKGTDTPGDQSGNAPGNQPGDINPGTEPGKAPGDQPGDTPSTKPGDKPGAQPGDQPGSTPGDQPGQTAVADPTGDLQMTVSLPGAGKDPGKEPGKDSSGQTPGQGQGKGEGSGKEPGDKPGSGKGSGQGEGQGQGSGPGSGSGSGSGMGSGSGTIPSLVPADRAGQTAANAQAALSDRTETINRAARQLERGSGSGSGAGTGPGQGSSLPAPNARTTDLILGAQLAQAVLATPEAAKLANTIVNQVRREPSGTANVVMPADLRGAADRLRLLLAAALSDDRRDETVRRFNPEDIDPAYREAVESYFERLSREARKP